ncbi:MAG: insulinase family protein [Bryobacterales bacterium]|nr:insulinase family protein [Bryobacterales bacterium]
MRCSVAWLACALALAQVPAQKKSAEKQPAEKKPAAKNAKAAKVAATSEASSSVAKSVATRPAPKKEARPFDAQFGLSLPAPRPLRLPGGDRWQLSNGLRVVVLPEPKIPIVQATLVVAAGSLADPAEKAGLADITAKALRGGGSVNFAGVKFDRELNGLGASLNVKAQERVTACTLTAPSDRFGKAAVLLADIVLNPGFDPDAFDLVRGELRSQIGKRNELADQIANREFWRIVYGPNNPSARRMEYEHLDNIGPEDADLFYSTYYRPGTAVLIIHGDIETASAKQLVDRLFSSWKPGKAEIKAPAPGAQPKPGVYLADKKDAPMSAVVMGFAVPPATARQTAAAGVAIEIVAGGPGSRLEPVLRDKKAWEAVAVARWIANDNQPGALQFTGRCKPAYTTDMIQAVLREFDGVKSVPFTETEVRDASARLLARGVMQWQNPGLLLAENEAHAVIEGRNSYVPDEQAEIAAVTREQAVAAFNELWKPSNLVITVVGSPTLFDHPLADLNRPVELIDLTIPPPPPLQPRTDPDSLSRGKQWLERIQAAMGGTDRLKAVKDFMMASEGSYWRGRSTTSIKQTDWWMAPGVFRQHQAIPIGEVTAFYDGAIGWLGRERFIAAMPPNTLRQVRTEIFQLLFTLVQSNHMPDRTVCSLGANIVQVTDDKGQGVRLYINEKTALPSRVAYLSVQPGGESIMVEQTYEDWREYDGIKMPTTYRIRHNGHKFTDMRVTALKFNSGLKVKDLERKP